MEKQIDTNQKKLIKELDKYGVEFSSLSEREKELLKLVNDYYDKKTAEFAEVNNQLNSIKFNTIEFCKYAGISRAALYKKKNEKQIYKTTIMYLNTKQSQFDESKRADLKKYLLNLDADYKLLNQLLVKQLDIINAEEQIKELLHANESLKREIKELKSNISKLNCKTKN